MLYSKSISRGIETKMKTYYVTNERTAQRLQRLAYKGGAEQIRMDYSSWAEDNGAVTGVTITVEYGDAAVSSESLAANIKSFYVTTNNPGKSLLKMVATDGTDKDVQWLEIWVKDLTSQSVNDYGL